MAEQQRIAVVTGGVTGIGAATSRMLDKSGFRVAATYLGNRQDAENFTQETGIPSYEWDIADFEACQRGIEQITGEIGPVDVLVNNAGITRDGVLHKMAQKRWTDVIDVDLSGCFNMCHAVVPGMRERGYGRIVNVSSVNGLSGQFGQTNYSAAKAGVAAMTVVWAKELARYDIRSVAIAPGFCATDILSAMKPGMVERMKAAVPLKRLGEPAEIAATAVFIAENDFVTGRVVEVDGGLRL